MKTHHNPNLLKAMRFQPVVHGFSVIELLVVLVIMALVFSGVGQILPMRSPSSVAKTQTVWERREQIMRNLAVVQQRIWGCGPGPTGIQVWHYDPGYLTWKRQYEWPVSAQSATTIPRGWCGWDPDHPMQRTQSARASSQPVWWFFPSGRTAP